MSLSPCKPGVLFAVIAALYAAPMTARAQSVQGVVAVVNDQAISKYDLEQRMRLVLSSSGSQPSAETIRRIQPQVLRSLVDERLQLQEAKKQKIAVSEEEVEDALGMIAKQNNMNADGIETFMAKSNIDIATLKSQIRAEMAWQRLIGERYGSNVHITEGDVTSEYDRYVEAMAHPQYLVSEIYLPIENPDQESEVSRNASDLLADLRRGAPFATLARQFSKAPSASSGGDLGWVQTGQLEAELNGKLRTMSPGQISEPIRTAGGYRILYLRNRREAGTAGEGELKRVHLKQIAIQLPERPTQAQVEAAEAKAARISDEISGCASVDRVRGEAGVFVNDFGDLAANQISPFIQQAASRMDPGEPSPPLRGPGGIVILVVCSKQTGPAPKAAIPTKDEIQERMISQQLSIQSRRYLRDLRRDAVIEYRVPLVN